MRIATLQLADGRWAVVDLDQPDRHLSVHRDKARAMTAGAALWLRREAPALVAAADDTGAIPAPDGGTPFYAVIGFQGVESDDGRLFREFTWRTPPIPLWCQFENLGGHDGAVIVGRFDTLTLAADGLTIQATGWYDGSSDAQKAIQQAREKTNYGISVDATGSHYPDWECMEYDAESGWCNRERTVYPTALIVSATQVGTPAFGLAQISLDAMPAVTPTPAADPPEPPEGTMPDFFDWFFFSAEQAAAEPASVTASADSDLVIVEQAEDCGCDDTTAVTAAAIAAREEPPAAWFDDPQLDGPTAMTVTDDGRVLGHIALWDTCHVGFPDSCTLAPRSESAYAYFHTGEVITAEGTRVAVGTLTMDTGHADLATRGQAAVAHYDHTGTQAAHVRCGEDEHGIWIAGALARDLDDEQVRRLLASAPSGDWRRIGAGLELVAVLAVNVPGFPTPRAALAASATPEGQRPEALVAAGAASLVAMAAEPWRADVAELRREVKTLTSAMTQLLPLARSQVRGARARARQAHSR